MGITVHTGRPLITEKLTRQWIDVVLEPVGRTLNRLITHVVTVFYPHIDMRCNVTQSGRHLEITECRLVGNPKKLLVTHSARDQFSLDHSGYVSGHPLETHSQIQQIALGYRGILQDRLHAQLLLSSGQLPHPIGKRHIQDF